MKRTSFIKPILLLCLSLALKTVCAQQDPQYNLYQYNQMAINPAYAGARDAIAAVVDMRKQWVSFPGAPTTLAATIHGPTKNNKLGLGINVLSDQIGARTTNGVYGNIAYIARISNRLKLSFGLRAGYVNYRFNFNKVNYKDPNESAITDLANTNKSALDIDAGLYLRSNTFYVGLSATHLNNANIYSVDYNVTNSATGISQAASATYAMRSHLFLIVGKAFSGNENFVFSPSVMLRNAGGKTSADLNLNFLIQQRLWLGVALKKDYGLAFLAQVYATDNFRIGYSYDSGLGTRRLLGPSHEIMLGFDFKTFKSKTVSPRFL